jgi:hypothetical protein
VIAFHQVLLATKLHQPDFPYGASWVTPSPRQGSDCCPSSHSKPHATFLRSASLNSGSTTCGLRVTGTSYFVRPKCRNERKRQQYRASDYKCALMVLGLETSSELRISDVLRNGQLMPQVSAPFRPPRRARRPRTLQPIAGRGCAKCHVVGRAPSGALRPGTLEQACRLNSMLWLRSGPWPSPQKASVDGSQFRELTSSNLRAVWTPRLVSCPCRKPNLTSS